MADSQSDTSAKSRPIFDSFEFTLAIPNDASLAIADPYSDDGPDTGAFTSAFSVPNVNSKCTPYAAAHVDAVFDSNEDAGLKPVLPIVDPPELGAVVWTIRSAVACSDNASVVHANARAVLAAFDAAIPASKLYTERVAFTKPLDNTEPNTLDRSKSSAIDVSVASSFVMAIGTAFSRT
jgi:hypothetical protein